MPNFFCVSITFLDPVPTFHGRGDADKPEWPPSPLRVFQALVAAAASRWREQQFKEYARPALEWLQKQSQQSPPLIIAPAHRVGVPVRLAVPNNDLDVVATAWAKRQQPKKQPSELKTMKTVRPTRLVLPNGQPEGGHVYYLFPLADGGCPHVDVLGTTARSITHLGWGVDMVAGNASTISEDDAAKLPGDRWRPVEDTSANGYRVPNERTLDALITKHEAFLNRVGPDGFRPVTPLAAFAFRVVGYRRPQDTAVRPFAAFEIWKPLHEIAELPAGKSRFCSFDTVCRFAHLAGMVRHAAAGAARQAGWDESRVNSFILGHGDGNGGQATTDDRLMFVPLPSITPLKVERIRRILVVGPPGSDIASIRQLLSGGELKAEGRPDPVAMLSVISQSDSNVLPYTRPACVWSTVTPVVLPGFDDPDGLRKKLKERPNAELQKHLLARLDRGILELIQKAFQQAGWPKELVEHIEPEYREVGFRAGVDLARRYKLPPLNFPRYHVRVRFAHRVRGPLVIGAGRYRGLGLFAAESDSR